MSRRIRLVLVALLVAANALIVLSAPTHAQPAPKPVDLPCATNVSAQVLGTGTPSDIADRTLVLVRIIFGPNGSIGAHTHPGTLVVVVESGVLGVTLLDAGEMSITRAATDGTPAAPEPLVTDQETTLDPGDGFVELGMIHSARSIGDEPAVVLISGLIEAGQPLTQCVDGAGTPASTAHE